MDKLFFSANLMQILQEVKWNGREWMEVGKFAYRLLFIIFIDRPVVFRVGE
jgi:hypothetical protein